MILHKTTTSGNDFIIVSRREFEKTLSDENKFIKNVCDRNKNLGADGVIFYTEREKFIEFSIFNNDGNEAEISGNGMAGLSAVMFSEGFKTDKIKLKTKIGIRNIKFLGRIGSKLRLDVDMGIPDFNDKFHFPFIKSGKKNYEYKGIRFYPVSTGNPHAVVLLEENHISISDLSDTGNLISNAPVFPNKTNVEFIFPFNPDYRKKIPEVKVFFYERGVGVTKSSSTGSTAVFSVMNRLNIVKDTLKIHGDEDPIIIFKKGDSVSIESLTKIVYKGEYH